MSLLVDASVWSLALRRDSAGSVPEVNALRKALTGGDVVVTTGLVPQERAYVGSRADAPNLDNVRTMARGERHIRASVRCAGLWERPCPAVAKRASLRAADA